MTYIDEINEYRRQIDRIDNDIIEKMVELSRAYKRLKQAVDSETAYDIIESSSIEKHAMQRNLDPWAVSQIFKEITKLITEEEAKPQ